MRIASSTYPCERLPLCASLRHVIHKGRAKPRALIITRYHLVPRDHVRDSFAESMPAKIQAMGVEVGYSERLYSVAIQTSQCFLDQHQHMPAANLRSTLVDTRLDDAVITTIPVRFVRTGSAGSTNRREYALGLRHMTDFVQLLSFRDCQSTHRVRSRHLAL